MTDPGFPRRGRQSRGGANLIFGKVLAEHYMKEFGSRGTCVPSTTPIPLDLSLKDPAFLNLVTVCNVVAARLCFHRHLWSCSLGCVSQHALGQTPPGRHPLADTPWADTPRQTPPTADTSHSRHQPPPPQQTSPPRRPLQRTVRILLECILVIR